MGHSAILALGLTGLLAVGAGLDGGPMPVDVLTSDASASRANLSLRFQGHGTGDIDRVKIRLDAPAAPVDVGRSSFTLELWLRAAPRENPAGAIVCGRNVNWIYGHTILDRDRFNRGRKFGLSLAGGRLVWGVTGRAATSRTICGRTRVADRQWHHVAVDRRRSDGRLRIWVDGRLDARGDGPNGDVSYPNGSTGGRYCGNGDDVCTSDPFLVVGAEKHDAGRTFPSFSGWLDELRVSTTLRYAGSSFPVPRRPFRADRSTVGLYHFDEGSGSKIHDASRAGPGPSDGVRKVGGAAPKGPRFSDDDPFR